MGQIEDLRTFLLIVEQGSIGKAAEQTGIAKSAMSRKLRLLEERMQTALVTRTTRQWSLTEAGREYYERGTGMLAAFDEFEAGIHNDNEELKGEIRLSIPMYFGQMTLKTPLLEFAQRHPDVRLNVDFSDRMVDIIAEHYDLVIRISDHQDAAVIVRPLCQTRHVICASPDYIANGTAIEEPMDLQSHRIIQYGSTKRPRWTLTSPTGKDTTVSLVATLNSHDGAFLIAAAEQKHGVAKLPDFLARESLESGRLVQLLGDHTLEPREICFVYPASRFLPQRTRALMAFLLSHVETEEHH